MPTICHDILSGIIILQVKVSSLTDIFNPKTYDALLDTGASRTAISKKIIEDFSLLPEKKIPVALADGTTVHARSYNIKIDIFNSSKSRFNGSNLNVINLEEKKPKNFDVLIGMDILKDFHLTLYGGRCVIST